MSDSEIKYKLEIVRLNSLCRYAASELRALDDIISQRHPMSSGLPRELVDSLEGSNDVSFVSKYKDLQKQWEGLLQELESAPEDEKEFQDLKIEIR